MIPKTAREVRLYIIMDNPIEQQLELHCTAL